MPIPDPTRLDVIAAIARGIPFAAVVPGAPAVLCATTLADWVALYNGLGAALEKTRQVIGDAVGDDTILERLLDTGEPEGEAADD